MNALRRILALLILPLLGYLIGATIFNHFWNKVEPGDLKNATIVAVAKSCERHGPVAWRGFGYYYECETELRSRSGKTSTTTVTGWLKPSDIGKEYAAHTMRKSQLQPDVRTESQVLLGWVCTFVFAIVYLFAYAYALSYLFPHRFKIKRRTPTRYEPPAG